jgi:hypothetical protein
LDIRSIGMLPTFSKAVCTTRLTQSERVKDTEQGSGCDDYHKHITNDDDDDDATKSTSRRTINTASADGKTVNDQGGGVLRNDDCLIATMQNANRRSKNLTRQKIDVEKTGMEKQKR